MQLKLRLFLPVLIFGKTKWINNLMSNDRKFLREAVEIAISGIKKGGGPFGAVIVKDNAIIAGFKQQGRPVRRSDRTRRSSCHQGSREFSENLRPERMRSLFNM